MHTEGEFRSMPIRRPIPLDELLSSAGVMPLEVLGRADAPIAGLSDHAQKVQRHGLFLARRGTFVDSHLLVSDAVERGAAAVLVDRPIPWYPGTTVVLVEDARKAAGLISQAFHNHPGRRMMVAGVTGTAGKTSVTHLVESILQVAGLRTGLIGTLYYRWGKHLIPAENTTPSSVRLGQLLSDMEADRVQAVVMEVSSHAIEQHRVAGIPFRAGALTQVGQDHLDYHGTLPAYIGIKRRFFFDFVAPVAGSTAMFNLDDAVGEELAFHYGRAHLDYSVSEAKEAPIRARDTVCDEKGVRFRLTIEGRSAEVQSALLGEYNISNMLAAAGIAHVFGVDVKTIAEGIGRLRSIPGRFERIDQGQDFQVVVDFAHAPLAMDRMLRSARHLTPGRLITVYGCGGMRDSSKRSLMGEVVGRYSDYAIITNDNTRREDPERIAGQTLEGLLGSGMRPNRAQILLDRRKAIGLALAMAEAGDTVVIAGRGHERFLDLGTQVMPFDDREVTGVLLRELLMQRKPRWIPEEATLRNVMVSSSTSIACKTAHAQSVYTV
jgi:UDP-N-acetylmuramoyl-L-alanyl-D-glutamate--2,6-diaminopimelate ligase